MKELTWEEITAECNTVTELIAAMKGLGGYDAQTAEDFTPVPLNSDGTYPDSGNRFEYVKSYFPDLGSTYANDGDGFTVRHYTDGLDFLHSELRFKGELILTRLYKSVDGRHYPGWAYPGDEKAVCFHLQDLIRWYAEEEERERKLYE